MNFICFLVFVISSEEFSPGVIDSLQLTVCRWVEVDAIIDGERVTSVQHRGSVSGRVFCTLLALPACNLHGAKLQHRSKSLSEGVRNRCRGARFSEPQQLDIVKDAIGFTGEQFADVGHRRDAVTNDLN
jgi:hypothetical protein